MAAGASTITEIRTVTAEVRARLDARCPGWRGRVLGALTVELRLVGGQVIRCALVQRPSPVRDLTGPTSGGQFGVATLQATLTPLRRTGRLG